jgi:isopentenyl-diphosphate delta-isomerase
MADETARRKDAHLDLCATRSVEPEANDSLLGEVHLIHEALPELAADQVDTRCSFLGKPLALPLLITGMSGGTERSQALNRDLARVAEEAGIAFGVGSQRAMLKDPSRTQTFQVRAAAPKVALLGNVGLWQARELGADGVRRLMEAIDADGIAVHLNVGQELIQPEGDRDFRGGLETLSALAKALGDRLVVKETGCGIGPSTARRLLEVGVRVLDVSGLGGTSWVRVESLRAAGRARSLGELFSGWGIPTAACTYAVGKLARGRALVIASGGVRDGLGAAKALALGAGLAGTALPVFRAWDQGGLPGARDKIEEVAAGLRLAMALTGSASLAALDSTKVVLGPQLRRWIEGLDPP